MTAAMPTLVLVAPLALGALACATDAPRRARPRPRSTRGSRSTAPRPGSRARCSIASTTIPSGPRPDWVLADPRSGVLVFVGSDAGAARAQKIAETFDVARVVPRGGGPGNPFGGSRAIDAGVPDPTGDAGAPAVAPPDDLQDALARGARQVDDTHWVVERALIDRLLADPMAMARGARIVPSMKNGQPDGLKLYAIRRTSFWAHVGLQNGDTLHAVNGYDLSSPDKALEAYARLRNASALEVELTRRGRDLVLNYAIQ